MLRSVSLMVVLFVLAACVPVVSVSPLPTPTRSVSGIPPQVTSVPIPAQQEGMGAVQGQLAGAFFQWRGREVRIYAAPYQPMKDGTGFFILEPTVHPSAVVNADGKFRLNNVPPGAYVFVAGPTPEDALAIRESGQPKVFQVEADQTLELGRVDLQ